MRMARANVYLPDDLAREARQAGVNISAITQAALRRELAARKTSEWLRRHKRLGRLDISHDQVLGALRAAREELGSARR
jgi:post-segregation antitoxin (ccd killing protein)